MRSSSVVVLAFAAILASPLGAQAPASGGASRAGPWSVARAVLRAGTTPSATRIELTSGIAVRDDVRFQDGTIDFDLAPPMARGSQFAGIAFRMAGTADYEILYFSTTDDGTRWRDIQYQPVLEGETTWQLYPGPDYSADIAFGGDARAMPHPTHVRVVVRGTRADVYLDTATAPALRVRALKRNSAAGSVGVWAVSPDSVAAQFSNFSVSDHVAAEPTALAPFVTPSGQLMHWQLSERLPSPDSVVAPRALTPQLLAAVSAGKFVDAEPSGLVNLTRALGNPAGRQRDNVFGGAGWGMAVARTVIQSDAPRRALLHFGYSDGVGIFLNGQPLFLGRNDYHSRFHGYQGRLSFDADAVALPLRAGANELVFIVTDKAFGWGFAARLL